MKMLENKKIMISRSVWSQIGLKMGWFDMPQAIRMAQISKSDVEANIMLSGYGSHFVLTDEKLNKLNESTAKNVISEAFAKLIKIRRNDMSIKNIMANMVAGKTTNIEVGNSRENKGFLIPYFNGQSLPYYNELTALVRNINGQHHSFGTVNILPIKSP